MVDQVEGRFVLAEDGLEDLEARIHAERSGHDLLERVSRLSRIEREAIDLVDLAGLSPKEAAFVLGVSAVLRVRLFRAHQQSHKAADRSADNLGLRSRPRRGRLSVQPLLHEPQGPPNTSQ